MWNSLIKGLAGIVFLVVFALTLRTRSKKRRLQNMMILFVAASVVITLALFRIENTFYSFPTVDSVAEYVGAKDVLGIVDGKDSSMIVYAEGEVTVRTMIVPKSADGYKIGNDIDKKDVASDITRGYIAHVTKSRKCSDHYIMVMGVSDTPEVSVEDSAHSAFVISQEERTAGEQRFTRFVSFAFVEHYGDGYSVTINNKETIPLS